LTVFLTASEPSLAAFRSTVGPAELVVPSDPQPLREPSSRLIVVNWNVHVGNGDVLVLIDRITSTERANGRGRPEFVLLLEEAVRQSAEIPVGKRFKVPARISRPDGKLDITALAHKLGWWMYYAPSMRNGDGTGALAEDRGNAILSSLPLQSVEQVELPFAVQRRVAVVATVADTNDQARLRVAVTHFDTRAPLLQGWIFGGPAARNRQAIQLVATLKRFQNDGLPLIVGGDLNTAIASQGVLDAMTQIAPRADCGSLPTHAFGLRLDHLFADMPTDWARQCARAEAMFGSDHYPLVLSVNTPW
jgi:endonuclease/exonuclease/phosphatase family metal-dependent hydrolase